MKVMLVHWSGVFKISSDLLFESSTVFSPEQQFKTATPVFWLAPLPWAYFAPAPPQRPRAPANPEYRK